MLFIDIYSDNIIHKVLKRMSLSLWKKGTPTNQQSAYEQMSIFLDVTFLEKVSS